MVETIAEMMSHAFIQRALLVGVLISLCAALLGVSLVLKRYSMIGDGLSHVGFGCVAIALAVGMQPLFIAIPLVVVAAYILLRLGESKKIKGDAAIALISSSALAIGYLVGNLADGFSSDINTYMFGSIATASIVDLYYIVPITLSILIIFLLLYNRIFSVTFDESLVTMYLTGKDLRAGYRETAKKGLAKVMGRK